MSIDSPNPVLDKLRKVLSEWTDPADVYPHSNLSADLGLDSLDLLEFAYAVEDEFDVEFSPDLLSKQSTVQSVLDHIEASQ
jgi:acyl carrier protein